MSRIRNTAVKFDSDGDPYSSYRFSGSDNFSQLLVHLSIKLQEKIQPFKIDWFVQFERIVQLYNERFYHKKMRG